MAALALWLEEHRDKLISLSLQELSTQEALRREAEGPVRWFFDSLIKAIARQQHDRLEALLRNWVAMSSTPINGYTVGLLPVLGVFKRAMWQEYQADPPAEDTLALAIQLDNVITKAAEFLSKVEASALLDAASHRLTARHESDLSHIEQIKSGFISIAAHELKTPLTVIEGYASMLKAQLSSELHPREAAMVQGIETGILRLRQVVEDMVDVSLLESRLLTLDYQPIWLRRILALAVSETQKSIGSRNLVVEFKQDTVSAASTIGDPEQLLKAFQKILINAVKYTPDGGRITIYGQERKGYQEIIFADTGIGIAAEDLERIFDKFVTVGDPALHSSGRVKFKGGGPGLGLMIAKGIIRAHNGSVWAESAGCDEHHYPGSQFHIMLPGREIALSLGMLPFGMSELDMERCSVSRDITRLIASVGTPAAQYLLATARKGNDESAGESQSQTPAETATDAGADVVIREIE